MRLATKNSALLATHYDLVMQAAMIRLELLASSSTGWVKTLTAVECVDAGLCDEVRVFVKNELHSEEKVKQGRMRVIMSISVIDQIVERVLNSGQNGLEIANWTTIPSKPGLGLHNEGLEELESQMFSLESPAASDISGFDWSVPQWALDLDAKIRTSLTHAGSLGAALINRATVLGLSRLVFSNGLAWDQEVRGIQKSGSYNTSSTNSRIRVALMHITAARAGFEGNGIAMGDDAVETWHDLTSMEAAYQTLGFRLKDASRQLEFCSYRFHGNGMFEPARWHKMLASFLATSVRDNAHSIELLEALKYELRFSHFLPRLEALLRDVGWASRKE